MPDWWIADKAPGYPEILRRMAQIFGNIETLNNAIRDMPLEEAIEYIATSYTQGTPIGEPVAKFFVKFKEVYDGSIAIGPDNEIKQYVIGGTVKYEDGELVYQAPPEDAWDDYEDKDGPVSIFGNAQETEDIIPYLTLMTKGTVAAKALEIGVLGYLPLPVALSALLPYLGYKANQEFFDVSWNFDDFVSQFLHFTFEDNGFLVPAVVDTLGQVFVYKALLERLRAFTSRWAEGTISESSLEIPSGFFPFDFKEISGACYFRATYVGAANPYVTRGVKSLSQQVRAAGFYSGYTGIILASDSSFSAVFANVQSSNYENSLELFYSATGSSMSSNSATYNSKTVYYMFITSSPLSLSLTEMTCPYKEGVYPTGENVSKIAWTMVYGTYTQPIPHGIERKPEPFVPEDWPYPPFVLENEVTKDLSELVPINIPESTPWLTSENDPDTPSTNEALEPYIWPQVPQEAFPYYDPNENPDLAYDPEEATAPYPDPNNNTYIIPIILPDLIPEVDDILPDVDVPVPSSSGLSPENNIPDILLWPTIVPPYDSGGVSGMIHVYNPTASEFINFGKWLWVTYADATIDKIWNNPFDGIIGCHEIYAPVPIDVQKEEIRSGFLVSDTSAYTVPTRYIEVNCGSVIVPEYWNNYLDYAPYTKAFIYLPFIGIVELEADDIIGHAVQVKYGVDMYTGACVAKIMVAKNDYRNCLYQFSGNCAVDVPLSGGSQASIKGSMIAAAAFGLNGIAQGIISGGGIASGVASAISNVVTHAVSQKSSVQHSGTFGAAFGAMSTKKPYLIIKRPIQKVVPNYNQDYGYPAHKMVTLGNCKGYVRVREINVISPTANNDEKARIETLLKDGVYITQ